ncbi:MAG: MlaD family protein [Candidatus Eisenbacteria bacterium]
MAAKGLEWKVGLVVFAATIVLVGGVIYLGQIEIGRSGRYVRVAFPEVGGLNVGDPVMVSGLRRGAVESLELGLQEVIATVRLRPEVVLHPDARFSVENMGIMGEKFIAVDPGIGGDTLDTGDVVLGGYSPGITEAMAQLSIVLEDVGGIVARVESVLQDHEVIEPLEEMIAMLRDVSVDMQKMIRENRTDVRASMKSFRSAGEEMDDMLRANRGKIDSTFAFTAYSAERLTSTMDRLDGSIESLELVLKRLEHGQGTLGRLSRDDRLYKEMLEATQNLNDLLRDVRKNPKRYLSVEIF